MLLRNFYNMMGLMFTGGKVNDASYGEGSLAIKSFDGGVLTSLDSMMMSATSYLYCVFPMMSDYYFARNIYFGTSDTPVTFEDYTLQDKMKLGVNSNSLDGIKYDSTTKTYSNVARLSLKNNKSYDFEVKEIGITGGNGSFLIYREVLNSPITIPAGSTVTYTHKFEFKFPTV